MVTFSNVAFEPDLVGSAEGLFGLQLLADSTVFYGKTIYRGEN